MTSSTRSSALHRPKGKIGLVTFHFANNYGAVLQAYALQQYLLGEGYDAKFVDYRPPYMTRGGHFRIPKSKRDLHANASVLLLKLGIQREARKGKEQVAAYDNFREQHFRLTGKYEYLSELKESPPDVDALICGSDQIWNPPPRFGVDPVYYLDFGNVRTKKLSFAPSFGQPRLDDDYIPTVARLLKGLNAVSVREDSGVALVKKLTGEVPFWAPDPTVLISDYSAISKCPGERNYCFVYCLRGADNMEQAVQTVCNSQNLKAITPFNPHQHWKPLGETKQMGPSEWLGHINHSSYVVTNSFHATMFSVLFNRPFFCISLGGRNSALTERMRSLLARVGLEDQLLTTEDGGVTQDRIDKSLEIDWNKVNQKLKEWRSEATTFLESNLN